MSRKSIFILIIILIILALFLYQPIGRMFAVENGNATISEGYFYGSRDSPTTITYATSTGGVGSVTQQTVFGSDFVLNFSMNLKDIKFENNISSSKFKDDLRNANIRYVVDFYDGNGSHLGRHAYNVNNEKFGFFDLFNWDRLGFVESILSPSYSASYNITDNYKIIERIDSDDLIGVSAYSLVKITKSKLHIEEGGAEPADINFGDLSDAEYATVTIDLYGDNIFDENYFSYKIQSSNNIENVTVLLDN